MTTKLLITPEDANKAGVFSDCHGCLIATALKRQFNVGYVNVGVCDANIGEDMRELFWSRDDDNAVFSLYYNKGRDGRPDGKFPRRGDKRPITDFEPFTITLSDTDPNE